MDKQVEEKPKEKWLEISSYVLQGIIIGGSIAWVLSIILSKAFHPYIGGKRIYETGNPLLVPFLITN